MYKQKFLKLGFKKDLIDIFENNLIRYLKIDLKFMYLSFYPRGKNTMESSFGKSQSHF